MILSFTVLYNNKEYHPILNQIYDILAELHKQGKLIALCKVPAHTGIKGNEEASKQLIDMPGMIIIRLPHTGKGNGKTILASYTTLNHTTAVGNTKPNYILDTLD